MQTQGNRNVDEPLVMKLEGSLDRETVPDIRKRLLKAVRQMGPVDLEVDLSDVGAIDTAGVALLLELQIVLSRKGQRMYVEKGNDNIGRMLRLACLDELLGTQSGASGGK